MMRKLYLLKKRTFLDFDLFPKSCNKTNLFISRVPNEINSVDPKIIYWVNSFNSVWTAGIQSVKKLSQNGVNVTGCVDGLGQKELHSEFILFFIWG